MQNYGISANNLKLCSSLSRTVFSFVSSTCIWERILWYLRRDIMITYIFTLLGDVKLELRNEDIGNSHTIFLNNRKICTRWLSFCFVLLTPPTNSSLLYFPPYSFAVSCLLLLWVLLTTFSICVWVFAILSSACL